MSLRNQKNIEAKIIWNTLYECEVYGLIHNKNEDGKRKYLEKRIKSLPKSKNGVRSTLKKVMNSGHIDKYVTNIIKHMHPDITL